MKIRERSLWRWLSRAREEGYHIERIENTLASSTPDVEASTGAGGFWIELKTAARPHRPSTKVRFVFQLGQSRWLQRRWLLDRCAWLLVQVGTTRYLVQGNYAEALEDGLTEDEIAELSTAVGVSASEVLEVVSLLVWGDL